MPHVVALLPCDGPPALDHHPLPPRTGPATTVSWPHTAGPTSVCRTAGLPPTAHAARAFTHRGLVVLVHMNAGEAWHAVRGTWLRMARVGVALHPYDNAEGGWEGGFAASLFTERYQCSCFSH